MTTATKSGFEVMHEFATFVTNMRKELEASNPGIDFPESEALRRLQNKLDEYLYETQMELAQLMKPKLKLVK